MSIETSELRRRIRAAIELSKKNNTARRTRSDAAAIDYETFLGQIAVPTIQQFASALTGEGHLFHVATPAGSVRLTSGSSADDYIEVVLDTAQDPPEVVARVNHGRGRRGTMSERPLRERTAIADLTEEDVMAFLLTEIVPFVSGRG